ncbi:integrase [Lachnospiraceae bacterium PF1-21]
MAKAKQLPSGMWRALAFSHKEPVINPKTNKLETNDDGTPKMRRIYESFTAESETEANYLAAEFMYKKSEMTKPGNWSLEMAFSKYIEIKRPILSPRTIQDYESTKNNHLKLIMHNRISKLTQDDIQQAINIDSLSVSSKTLRNIHGLLSAVLKAYRPDFALNTTLPKKGDTDLFLPSNNDFMKLLSIVKDTEMELPILLAAMGPMRRGEICALTTDYINENRVHVHFNMVFDKEATIAYKEKCISEGKDLPKKRKQYRIKLTKNSRDRWITYPNAVAELWKGKEGKITNLTPDDITDKFRAIRKKAELPKLRFHDLRHYSASIQHALGVKDAYIMSRGGWTTDRVLKEVYRHTVDEVEVEMTNITNDYFENVLSQIPTLDKSK